MRAARPRAVAATLAAALGLASAPDLDAKPVTVADLLAGSPAADWRVPNPDDTLYLELAHGRVVIELATRVVPQHAANIKALVRAHYFDGLAVIRVQDNYVVQWDDETHRRPLPPGVRPSVEFTADAQAAVIGNAPRQLDLNVALVGRVLKGMEFLSTLPRGSGEMGFYVAAEPPAPISSVRLASDVPPAERTRIEVLRTESATFRSVLEQRRERREPWFKHNPGAIDLCNVPLPVRVVPTASP